MRWAGHVAIVGEETGVYRVLVVDLEGKKPLGNPRRRCVNKIRWITRSWVLVYGLNWVGPGSSQIADACEGCNETSGYVKNGEILDQLKNS